MALLDTTTGEVIAVLTPAEARSLTDTIKANTETLWALLFESYERQAWSALGYGSWREYATTEFGMSQSRAYQLLDQAKVITAIAAAGSTSVELTEATTRDLKPVLQEAVAAVKEATAEVVSDDEKKERVRAALDNLRDAMVEQRRPKVPAPTDATPAIEKVMSSGDDVQVAQLRKRFADALVRSGSAFTFQVEQVAPHLDEQGWQIAEHTARQSAEWFARLLAAKPKKFAIVKGGRA